KAGYRTARVGKHHNGPEEVYFFETKVKANSRSPVEMANACESFIAADDERPFFLYYATSDPHRGGGEATELPHAPNRFGNRPNGGAYPHVKEVVYDPAKVNVPPFLPDTPTCRAEIAQYYQSISRVDQGVGRLVQILQDADRWDDTLVLFTSDHGMAFPGGKTTVYEGGLRVPFIVRNPYEERRGVESDALVSLLDITPSLLDFAGVWDSAAQAVDADLAARPPSRRNKKSSRYKMHGRSFLPIVSSKEGEQWNVIYASHTFHEITMYYPMRVVRDRQYKLIWNVAYPLPYPFASDLWAAPTWQAQYKQGLDAPYGRSTVGKYIKRPQFELFDIANDPNETKNLAGESGYADVLKKYKDELKKFQQRTQDPWLLKWTYE
ncbi:MAG: sulfatase-like hydrolase/transferase, partial [Pirellulaceae bacterium]|nr:sulfatase-like hydrolase/transferase [Pirellulaceae bacterium]